jgi:hypothetical protein
LSDDEPVAEKARIGPRHLSVLRKVHERLHHGEINWVVCAGMSLALQGVPALVQQWLNRTQGSREP